MTKFLLSIFGLFSATILFSQAPLECGTDHLHNTYLKNHPNASKEFLRIEKAVQAKISNRRITKSTEQVYQVPVVIHVVHLGEAVGVGNNISEAQIMSGLDQLNNAFRNVHSQSTDTKIEFFLAKQDDNCNATTGIVRIDGSGVPGYSTDGVSGGTVGADEAAVKALSKWDNQSFLNIWLVNEIDGNDGGFGVQGYAYFPGTSATYDGALIMNTAWGNIGTVNNWNNQSKTVIHELGHSLGLYHTFNGDSSGTACPLDTNYQTGDLCADTDPHIRSASGTCPSGINSCTGQLLGDVVHNYLDYSDQDCQYMFTPDQIARMRAALETTRKGLITSKGLSDPITAFSDPIAASCTPTTQALGLSGGFAGIMSVSFGELFKQTSYSSNDGGYMDFTGNCLDVVYVYTDSTYDLTIESWVNTSYTKAWIDYNNDGNFDNSTELVFDKAIPSKSTSTENVVIPNTATLNTFLRMRVLLEAGGTVSSACLNPVYGQAEDYSVYIQDGSLITALEVETTEAFQNTVIAPNPFQNSFTLQSDYNAIEPVNFIVTDIHGRMVQTGTIAAQNKLNVTFDLSRFDSGVYHITLSNSTVRSTYQMIKK